MRGLVRGLRRHWLQWVRARCAARAAHADHLRQCAMADARRYGCAAQRWHSRAVRAEAALVLGDVNTRLDQVLARKRAAAVS